MGICLVISRNFYSLSTLSLTHAFLGQFIIHKSSPVHTLAPSPKQKPSVSPLSWCLGRLVRRPELCEGWHLSLYSPTTNCDKAYKLALQCLITKNEKIQGNNLPKIEKIQGNNSAKIEKIQSNNSAKNKKIQGNNFLLSDEMHKKTVIVAAFFIYYKAIFPFILSARTDIKHRVDEYSIPQFLRSAPYHNCHQLPFQINNSGKNL